LAVSNINIGAKAIAISHTRLLWVAARSPITYDYAIKNNCNIMCWPLTRRFDEAELYKQRFDESMAKFRKRQTATFCADAPCRHL
jgi:hypothetical protein